MFKRPYSTFIRLLMTVIGIVASWDSSVVAIKVSIPDEFLAQLGHESKAEGATLRLHLNPSLNKPLEVGTLTLTSAMPTEVTGLTSFQISKYVMTSKMTSRQNWRITLESNSRAWSLRRSVEHFDLLELLSQDRCVLTFSPQECHPAAK